MYVRDNLISLEIRVTCFALYRVKIKKKWENWRKRNKKTRYTYSSVFHSFEFQIDIQNRTVNVSNRFIFVSNSGKNCGSPSVRACKFQIDRKKLTDSNFSSIIHSSNEILSEIVQSVMYYVFQILITQITDSDIQWLDEKDNDNLKN